MGSLTDDPDFRSTTFVVVDFETTPPTGYPAQPIEVNAPAEDLADHVPARSVDAVVCNSAVWKTGVAAVVTAVRRVLRPEGRFVFNIGGVFAGVTHPDEQVSPTGPSLSALIEQIAARDYGIVPPTATVPAKLPLPVVTGLLADAGLHVVAAEVTGQHTSIAERAAWLSIPVFAHPEGALSYEQKMAILAEATAQTTPDDVTVTSWLVIVAELPEEA